jgi:hypothetical protein
MFILCLLRVALLIAQANKVTIFGSEDGGSIAGTHGRYFLSSISDRLWKLMQPHTKASPGAVQPYSKARNFSTTSGASIMSVIPRGGFEKLQCSWTYEFRAAVEKYPALEW